ncbi:MAG TPA: hypothetical protein VNS32_22605 [Flavisolibacter sp.]|nr:hypothetical protein [Flavisolibacter sp.]
MNPPKEATNAPGSSVQSAFNQHALPSEKPYPASLTSTYANNH